MEALITKWQEPLWRHAMRQTRNATLADDVLQESLVAIARKIGGLKDPGSFRTWAYRIVSNKTADLIRKRQRNRELDAQALEQEKQAQGEPTPNDEVGLIRAAMTRLNSRDRTILSLFYLEEMSVAEVSEICGIPSGTVKSRLSKARSNLKKILDTHLNSNHSEHE